MEAGIPRGVSPPGTLPTSPTRRPGGLPGFPGSSVALGRRGAFPTARRPPAFPGRKVPSSEAGKVAAPARDQWGGKQMAAHGGGSWGPPAKIHCLPCSPAYNNTPPKAPQAGAAKALREAPGEGTWLSWRPPSKALWGNVVGGGGQEQRLRLNLRGKLSYTPKAPPSQPLAGASRNPLFCSIHF